MPKVRIPASNRFAVGASLPRPYAGAYRPLDTQQERAYEEVMGRAWNRPWDEQFDYTGMPRGGVRRVSKLEQIETLTGVSLP